MKPKYFVVNMPDMLASGAYENPVLAYVDVKHHLNIGGAEPLIFRSNPNYLTSSFERITLEQLKQDTK